MDSLISPQRYAGSKVIENQAIEILGEEAVVMHVVDYFLSSGIPEGFGVVMCRLMPYAGFPLVHLGETTQIALIFEKVPPR